VAEDFGIEQLIGRLDARYIWNEHQLTSIFVPKPVAIDVVVKVMDQARAKSPPSLALQILNEDSLFEVHSQEYRTRDEERSSL
jgi:hypothetical protein